MIGSSMEKVFLPESVQICDQTIELSVNYTLSSDEQYDLGREWRDTRLVAQLDDLGDAIVGTAR
ncbi:hypothetical protein KFU94_46020 [Chloroflexi bacterium TSY]|nr:hypothetical protein [Chloroflexi bacterium TSY]